MKTRLTPAGAAYLATSLAIAAAVLCATIKIYTDWNKALPDTFSASIMHTAATLGAAAFVGAIDMFFKFEETKEHAEERKQWEARLERALEEAKAQREQNQQMFAALMEQNRLLTDRLFELLERRNGSANGASDAS